MPSLATTPATLLNPRSDLVTSQFSPEFQLVLACCSLRGNESTNLRTLVGPSLDWPQLLPLAEHHNVLPLVFQALQQIPGAVPSSILGELRARFEHNARKNLVFTGELIRILDCLQSHGVPAIPFKGPVLAEAVYGNLALREFSDLDILVHRSDFQRAKDALRKLAFVPAWRLSADEEREYLASGYECAFDGPAGRKLLELQWEILPRFYAVDFDMDGLFRRAGPISFGDRTVSTLAPEDLLLVLCAHAAKHAWTRLCWLRDIAGVIQSPLLDWNRTWQQAQHLGIARILRISLLLTHRLLGADAPQLKQTPDDVEIGVLCDGIARDLPNSEEYSTESVAYFRLMLRLRERWSDRVRFALRLIFTPSVGEWSVVRLPAFLFPLYRVIRLFRVFGRFLHFHNARNAFPEPE
jgi:hypothetical protein